MRLRLLNAASKNPEEVRLELSVGGVRVCQQRELFNNQVGWGQRSKAKAKSTEEMLARDNATPEQNRQRSKPREVRGRKKMWQRALYAYVRCYPKAR